MRYAIKNSNGQYWTGERWGVLQEREEYATLDALCGGSLDVCYYELNEDPDAVACVVEERA